MSPCASSGNRALHTARLILRPPVAADLDGFAALQADAAAARFLGGVKPRPVAWRSLAVVAGSWALHGFGLFSVIERGSGRWIGRVGPWQPDGWPGPEIGWGLLPQAQGQGFATEAAAASITWALDNLGWAEVVHPIAPDNTASQAVAARLGSVNRGAVRMPAPFQDDDAELWGQSAAAWRARHPGCVGGVQAQD